MVLIPILLKARSFGRFGCVLHKEILVKGERGYSKCVKIGIPIEILDAFHLDELKLAMESY